MADYDATQFDAAVRNALAARDRTVAIPGLLYNYESAPVSADVDIPLTLTILGTSPGKFTLTAAEYWGVLVGSFNVYNSTAAAIDAFFRVELINAAGTIQLSHVVRQTFQPGYTQLQITSLYDWASATLGTSIGCQWEAYALSGSAGDLVVKANYTGTIGGQASYCSFSCWPFAGSLAI